MINKAINFFEEEIVRLRKAPEINGCEMTPEWKEMLQIYNTAVEALRLRTAPKTNFERIKAMSVEEIAKILCEISHIQHIPEKVRKLFFSSRMTMEEAFTEWLESEVIE